MKTEQEIKEQIEIFKKIVTKCDTKLKDINLSEEEVKETIGLQSYLNTNIKALNWVLDIEERA